VEKEKDVGMLNEEKNEEEDQVNIDIIVLEKRRLQIWVLMMCIMITKRERMRKKG